MVRHTLTIGLPSCFRAVPLARGSETPPGSPWKEIAPASGIEVYEDKTGTETIESVQSKQFRPRVCREALSGAFKGQIRPED